MDAPISPTTSSSGLSSSPASSSAPAGGGGGGGAAAAAAIGASSSDSASAGGATPEHTPPRRRLVKAASRHFDEQPPRATGKREGGVGTGPPGFAFDRSSASPSPASPGLGGPANTPLGASSASPSISGVFRERERVGIRPSVKGDLQGDYSMNSPHGHAGISGPNKLGRAPFPTSPGVTDARPLGRRPEVNLRRHEAPNAQKHAEDMRFHQAKRAALVRTQTMGAPGNYKSFDSQFGNYLVPVIPNQFFNKNPPTSPASPALPSQNQGR